MTQEEKELLLKYLCAMLPYKIHCRVFNLNGDIKENDDVLYGVIGDNVITLKSNKDECLMYYQIKPYLRPMSSMTEEEIEEYWTKINNDAPEMPIDEIPSIENIAKCSEVVLDFLNSYYLDYHGLIPMGLALEAPEEMYNIK